MTEDSLRSPAELLFCLRALDHRWGQFQMALSPGRNSETIAYHLALDECSCDISRCSTYLLQFQLRQNMLSGRVKWLNTLPMRQLMGWLGETATILVLTK